VQDGMTQISRRGTTLIQFGKEEEDKDLGAVAQKPQSLIKKDAPETRTKLHFEYMNTN